MVRNANHLQQRGGQTDAVRRLNPHSTAGTHIKHQTIQTNTNETDLIAPQSVADVSLSEMRTPPWAQRLPIIGHNQAKR